MIEPYFGEFLVSPVPLELSLNYCSHKCAYCFANLNKPDRKASIASITNLLRDFRKRDTLAARLLQQGYPVLFSNKVDPFATSNYKQAVPLAETLVDLGIPIAWQTKGGRGLDKLLPNVPKACWYVSIGFTDDTLRASIEPGATTLESRYELIQQLVERGHTVNVGLNPLVPEWMPEPEPVLDRLKSLGVWGVWIEYLHLNYRQRNNLTDRERAAIGSDRIAKAMKRIADAGDIRHIERAGSYARSIGLETFSIGQPFTSGFFTPYYSLYGKLFPTIQQLVNSAYLSLEPGDLITFDDWWEIAKEYLPAGVHPLDHVIGSTAHDLFWEHKIPKHMTYRQLLGIIWQHPKCKAAPAGVKCFAYAQKDADTEWVDHQGMRVLTFVGETLTDRWYQEA